MPGGVCGGHRRDSPTRKIWCRRRSSASIAPCARAAFDRLTSRENLLALLTTIIARKAARKAPGPALRGVDDLSVLDHLGQDRGASPVDRAMLRDCYQRYVAALPPRLQAVAEMCLAGLTHREIARANRCAVRTVERKMNRVIHLWHELAAADAD